jgi:hypothetical protein
MLLKTLTHSGEIAGGCSLEESKKEEVGIKKFRESKKGLRGR